MDGAGLEVWAELLDGDSFHEVMMSDIHLSTWVSELDNTFSIHCSFFAALSAARGVHFVGFCHADF